MIVAAALLVGGCATEPAAERPAENPSVAYVRSTWHGHDAYYISQIDGTAVRRPVAAKDWSRPTGIAAGERQLLLRYEGVDPAGSDHPRTATGTVKAKLLAGVQYVAEGRDEGRAVTLWIQRVDTGERVSDEVIAKKSDREPLKPTVVPAIPDRILPIPPIDPNRIAHVPG